MSGMELAREMIALDPLCVLCWDALAKSLNAMAYKLDGAQAEGLSAEARQVDEHIARIAPDSWLAKADRANALWREGKRELPQRIGSREIDAVCGAVKSHLHEVLRRQPHERLAAAMDQGQEEIAGREVRAHPQVRTEIAPCDVEG